MTNWLYFMMVHKLTLEQMHKNISRMIELEKHDNFTDMELHEINKLSHDYYYVPTVDELDTAETINSGIEKDGTHWAVGDGYIRNS